MAVRTYPTSQPFINYDDWLSRDRISLDQALLLSIGENPNDINWHDTEFLCTSIAGETPLIYELRDQAEAWINNGTLNAEPTFDNDDIQQDYLVKPFDFFSLAVACKWRRLNKSIYNFVNQHESIENQADSKPPKPPKASNDYGKPKERQDYFRPIWEKYNKPQRNNMIWSELRKKADPEDKVIESVTGNDEFVFKYQDGSKAPLAKKVFQNDMSEIRKQK